MLCASAPEGKDTDFTWLNFQARNNNELVAIFGNLINRVVVLTHKYWEGIVPRQNALTDYDREILEKLADFPDKIGSSIEKFRFREAITELMNLARLGNKYLADTEPWKLKLNEEKRTETILNIAIQIAGSLAVLSAPFMPFTSKKLSKILNLNNIPWNDAGGIVINANHLINNASLLFEKIEDEKIAQQLEKLNS